MSRIETMLASIPKNEHGQPKEKFRDVWRKICSYDAYTERELDMLSAEILNLKTKAEKAG